MKDLRIKALELANFKGIKKFQLQLDGQHADIMADNAVGKTTLADAFYWVLFNKDSLGRSDFGIKTYDQKTGETLTGVEHAVTLALIIDGKEQALKKVYKEKWVKQKGKSKKQFSGHTYDYFVNDVPVKKKEFTEAVNEIIPDENVFKLLTGVKYFNEQLHWKERRDLLLDVCGDVSDREVIESNSKLEELPDIIGNKTAVNHKEQIREQAKKINKQLEEIPVRIDEVTADLPDIDSDKDQLEKDINQLYEQINENRQVKMNMQQGGQKAKLNEKLSELRSQAHDIKTNIKGQQYEKLSEINEEIGSYQQKIALEKGNMEQQNAAKERKYDLAKGIDNELQQLRDKWNEVNNKQADINNVCPFCEQEIPEGSRQKVLEEFNEDKANKLDAISKQGKELKAEKEQLIKEGNAALDTVKAIKQEISDLEETVEAKQAEYEGLQQQQEKQIEQEVAEINKQIADHEKQLNDLDGNLSDTVQSKQAEIDQLVEKVKEKEAELNQHLAYSNRQNRISELKQQEKELAGEYERLQKEIDLCEEFTRSKVNMLEDKVNTKFKLARFRLFDTYISGGLEETCETLYNGIPYSDLNSGHRIVIGMDIIKTLAEHYQLKAPIWIDNAESITGEYLPEVDMQSIKLIKPAIEKDGDKKLYSKLQVHAY